MSLVGPQQTSGTLTVAIRQHAPFDLDVSFSVAPGEVTAFVGPSGSGKSTTLRAIAGLSSAHLGRIALGDCLWFDSEQRINVRPEQRRIGMVFQDYALFPHLTVLANVALAMRHLPRETRFEAASSILDRVGIRALSERRPRGLSGGERQRVGLARALARDPAVLLLDEPFSAVDRPTRDQLKVEVATVISGLAIPTIFVTHDIDEALAIAGRMVVIDQGRIVADGPPCELRAYPPSRRVADIISAPRTGKDQASNRA